MDDATEVHDPGAIRTTERTVARPGSRAHVRRGAGRRRRRPRSLRGRTSRGHSLVELVVAASILAVALVASAAGVLESSELEKANAQTRSVGPLLAALLDEVRSAPFDRIVADYGGRTREVTGLTGCSKPGVATWTVSDAPGSDPRWIVRCVKVDVRWTGAHGTQHASAVTWISDRSIGSPPPVATVPVDPL